MNWLPLALAGIGLTGIVLALFNTPMQRWVPLTEPLVALLLGVLLGPAALGLIEISEGARDVIFLEGSRVLLALSVMAAAVRFGFDSLRGLLRPVLVLLIVVMPLAALITGLSALALGVPIALALVIGACLAPTDPVLAASVLTGDAAEKTLSERVRAMLTMESGANDGLGIVLVGVSTAVALPATDIKNAFALVGWEVSAGVAIGVAMGWLAGLCLRTALRHHILGEGPELVYTLLLALAVLGVARLLDVAGVLAVFMAGLAYNRMVPNRPRQHQAAVDEGINGYLVIPLFAILGAVLPWAAWSELSWRVILFLVGVVLLRRLGIVIAVARWLGVRRSQAAFMGWFGPMGVSALFYMAHARHEGVQDPALFSAITLAVSVSVVLYGVTANPGRKLYAAHDGDASRALGQRR
ncbi:cation:proton antiporter [Brachybacterium vulturis]|uniref:cation:proton antiporter domain-containing protein n=1 Tax=Brachybacterium vulturis TaxID=2017484 RepID=UPI003736221F